MMWFVIAALWGISEATFFFIVPDVLITATVLRFDLRRALLLAATAALFASLAGLFMWHWGHHDADAARTFLRTVPLIGPDLIDRATGEMQEGWALHLVTGAMTGVPYKIYAVEAGAAGINPALFFLASFVARFARFAATAVLMALGRWILVRIHLRRAGWQYALWSVSWVLIYAVYWLDRSLRFTGGAGF
jgi:membrane protein YqaA with SNARE-associated domain